MQRFARKKIWIIGASAGIGAALAKALSAEGAQLILSARDAAALGQLAVQMADAVLLPFDLGKRGALAEAISRLPDKARLDAVICTAALYDPSDVADLDPDRSEELVRVNLLGSIEVGRLCPPVLKQGGQLVLFGSVAGYVGLPGGQAYSASKAAVNNLAESLRLELAPDIDVRLVCPGFVRSRLTDKNDFAMPALMEPEAAAQAVLRGMLGWSFEIHFPKRFTLTMKLLRALPYSLSLPLLSRLRKR